LLEESDHLVREIEQSHEVADRYPSTADTTADLLAGEPELLDERGAGASLLDRAEVLTGHVLDQRQLERFGVVTRTHERRDPGETRNLRRAPTPLAGDELVSAARPGPHEHRLQHPSLAERACERLQRLLIEATTRLGGTGRDRRDRQLAQFLFARHGSLG